LNIEDSGLDRDYIIFRFIQIDSFGSSFVSLLGGFPNIPLSSPVSNRPYNAKRCSKCKFSSNPIRLENQA